VLNIKRFRVKAKRNRTHNIQGPCVKGLGFRVKGFKLRV
jgi:hypothetical protein